jgi:hypothetical protein
MSQLTQTLESIQEIVESLICATSTLENEITENFENSEPGSIAFRVLQRSVADLENIFFQS